MDIIQANLDNLTSLWRLGGQKSGDFYTNRDFAVSTVPNSGWPNKLWFLTDPDETLMEELIWMEELDRLTIPIWGSTINEQKNLLLAYGFEQKNELTGMSVKLDSLTFHSSPLVVELVTDTESATTWSRLFLEAFGYLIHPGTIVQTLEEVSYFTARYEHDYVGMVALYHRNSAVAGIHSMGVIPAQRGKGYAGSLLSEVLKQAYQQGAEYAVLQASEMGHGLYLKMGFQADFQLKNFIRTH